MDTTNKRFAISKIVETEVAIKKAAGTAAEYPWGTVVASPEFPGYAGGWAVYNFRLGEDDDTEELLAGVKPEFETAGRKSIRIYVSPDIAGEAAFLAVPSEEDGGAGMLALAVYDELPEARRIVLDCLLHGDGHRYDVIAAVVMPDHIHCILHPRLAREGHWHDLAAVLKPLKGVSARLINQQLGGKGSVWQAESFDRIIRTPKEYEAKIWYMRHNPVTAGLVAAPEEYEFRIDRRDIV